MDSTKIGGPRSRSTSCTYIEEARLMNRQVRLGKTRNKLRKFSDYSLLEECRDTTCDYKKERVCLISNSSDDIQANYNHTSKSCSNLISVHNRFGGSVEVKHIHLHNTQCVRTYKNMKMIRTALGARCGICLSDVW